MSGTTPEKTSEHRKVFRECEAAMIGFRTLAANQREELMKYIRARTYWHLGQGTTDANLLVCRVTNDADLKFDNRIDRDLIGDVAEYLVPQFKRLMANTESDDG